MATIQRIESESIHRIQSGQVITSLQSILKELLENAVDAHATSITITLTNSGLDAIEVLDNGDGIREADFPSIARKHHTSKLESFEGLDRLATFGFRGEALSSLTALARLTITTARQENVPMGHRVQFDAMGELSSCEVVAAQRGTKVTVENIFHNLPVRRKELERTLKREYIKVLTMLQAYACISTNTRLVLATISCGAKKTVGGRKTVVFATNGNATTRENIANVFGSKTVQSLTPLDLDLALPTTTSSKARTDSPPPARLVGHISRPVFGQGRATSDRQHFYINGRPCNLPQIGKAINDVYKAYNTTQSPFVLADLQLDTDAYDVNVSPDKRTVLVHDVDVVVEAVRTALEKLFEGVEVVVPFAKALRADPSQSQAGPGDDDDDDVEQEGLDVDVDMEDDPPSRRTQPSDVEIEQEEPESGSAPSLFVQDDEDDGEQSQASRTEQPAVASRPAAGLSTTLRLRQPRRLANSTVPSVRTMLTVLSDKGLDSGRPAQNDSDGDDSGAEASTGGDYHDIETAHVASDDGRDDQEDGKDDEDDEDDSDEDEFVGHPTGKDVPGGREVVTIRIGNKVSATDINSPSADPIESTSRRKRVRINSIGSARQNDIAEKDDPTITNVKSVLSGTFGRHSTFGINVTVPIRQPMKIPCFDQDDLDRVCVDRSSEVSCLVEPDDVAESRLMLNVTKDDFDRMKVVGQFNLGFIIVVRPARERVKCDDDGDGSDYQDHIFIIDQHASDEKATFEKLSATFKLSTQRLLQPVRLKLTAAEREIVSLQQEIISLNGFQIERTGRTDDRDDDVETNDDGETEEWNLVGLPVCKSVSFTIDDLYELIGMLISNPSSTQPTTNPTSQPSVLSTSIPRPAKVHRMLASKACRSSVMIGHSLTMTQMDRIVRRMGKLDKPWTCPHGRPTMRHLGVIGSTPVSDPGFG